MSTALAALNEFAPELSATSCAGSALGRLMRMWEQEHAVEEPDSDADLMVMLSGMVGDYATALEER